MGLRISSHDNQTFPLVATLQGSVSETVPVWMMRQAGRYLPEYRAVRQKVGGFLDLCYSPEFATEVTIQPIDRFGFDGAIIFSDILVVPHAMGFDVTFVEGEGPRVAGWEAGRTYPFVQERLQPVYDAVRAVRSGLPDHVALLGFAGAPWTLACYIIDGGGSRDFPATRLFAYKHPEAFAALLDALVEAIADHLIAQVEAGANALQIFDSWAGIVAPRFAGRYLIEPIRAIVDRVRAVVGNQVPIIGFPRGCPLMYRQYGAESGVSAVSLDATVSIRWAREALGPDIVTQGNLDPLVLCAGGDVLDAEVDNILDAAKGHPHVFNLGHGVIPQTPPEHVAQVIARIRQRSSAD